MTGLGRALIRSGITVLATGAAFLSAHGGGDRTAPEDTPRALPERTGDPLPEPAGRADSFGEALGKAFRGLGAQGSALKERLEGYYGMYRLLRALGMSDAEIARLVAGQARDRLEQDLRERTPTAGDARRVMDDLQERVLRAAEDVDSRLGLGGDFVRRVREATLAATTGREDALISLERGATAAREQLRKALNGRP